VIVAINEGYFRLFLMAKMGIFLNYGGAGSHRGGAGRITRCEVLQHVPQVYGTDHYFARFG